MRVPESMLPDGWEDEPHINGLRCPHGHSIEYDGSCPEGCTSPLREQGVI